MTLSVRTVCSHAQALIDHCLALGSRDNMSVVIVLLKPALKPRADMPPRA